VGGQAFADRPEGARLVSAPGDDAGGDGVGGFVRGANEDPVFARMGEEEDKGDEGAEVEEEEGEGSEGGDGFDGVIEAGESGEGSGAEDPGAGEEGLPGCAEGEEADLDRDVATR